MVYEQGPAAVVALVQMLSGRIEEQQEQLEVLAARVKELEDQLSKNSRNSSKPPSSDTVPPKPKSLREKSGRKPGGQPGHPGKTLMWVEQPDEVVTHTPDRCEGCGTSLDGVEVYAREKRQVTDLPPLRLEVVEHRAECKRCPGCGHRTMAMFPPGVDTAVGYGPRIKGLGVYLMQYQLIPFERTSELLSDLFGTTLSVGTLETAIKACYQELAPVEKAIKDGLRQAGVEHFDETGLKVAGKRRWLHSASTATLTHYGVHPKRGSEATKEIGVLPEFAGVAVHDSWSAYYQYECDHALCNAHHLRELTFLVEEYKQEWASKMKTLLLDLKREVEEANTAGRSCLDPERLKLYETRYQELIAEGHLANPPPEPSERVGKRGPMKRTHGKNLVDRLDKRRNEVLRFMRDFRVPFDNNQAERDVRMLKVQQKVSGCFRTEEGAARFCRIRGYISTVSKQGGNVLAELERAFRGEPFIPFLLPAE